MSPATQSVVRHLRILDLAARRPRVTIAEPVDFTRSLAILEDRRAGVVANREQTITLLRADFAAQREQALHDLVQKLCDPTTPDVLQAVAAAERQVQRAEVGAAGAIAAVRAEAAARISTLSTGINELRSRPRVGQVPA